MRLSLNMIDCKLLSRLLILTLVCQNFAFSVQAATSATHKIAFVPVSNESITLTEKNEAYANQIRNQLKSRLNILPVDATKQILSQNVSAKSPELAQAVHLVDQALENYYTYKTDAAKTLGLLQEALTYIEKTLPPSAETSKLLISAQLSSAWLEFKSGQKDKAQERIHQLSQIKPVDASEFDYYPGDFRHFGQAALKSSQSGAANLVVNSNPEAVNVYVNKILVGVTPYEGSIPAGDYQVALEAAGRQTQTRKVKLSSGQTKTVKANLPWTAQAKRNQNLLLGQNWEDATPQQKVALAARASQLTQSDMTVFVDVQKVQGGYLPSVKIYNAKFSQLLKNVSYFEPVHNLNANQDKIVSYLSAKLSPYLAKDSVTYWTKNIDREVIVDHRVASRGKKPLYKQPAFWGAVGGVVTAGVIIGILAAQSDDSPAGTGGVTIGF